MTNPALTVVTPLYGHTSPETAYQVDDYPYGFRLRCKIRYWIEHKPSHGYRFMSQTTNPKKPGEPWNKPKGSTYVSVAACMYLDPEGHVQWKGVGSYSSEDALAAFVRDFPGCNTPELRTWITSRLAVARRFLAGTAWMTVNGVRQPLRDDDKTRYAAEIATLEVLDATLKERG
jgi:hypothetical protein